MRRWLADVRLPILIQLIWVVLIQPMMKKIFSTPLVQICFMTMLILAGMLWPLGVLEHVENKNYDFWSTYFRSPNDDSVAIIAIDQESIRQMGDWPWPRSHIGAMVKLLSLRGALAQGICLLFTQPDLNLGLKELQGIQELISDPQWKGKKKNTRQLLNTLKSARARIDQDAHLITAVLRAKNAVLPIRFSEEKFTDDNWADPSALMRINSFKPPSFTSGSKLTFTARNKIINIDHSTPIIVQSFQEPFKELAGKAGALGHMNIKMDDDGVVRRVPLLVDYNGRLYPSMALQLALKSLNLKLQDLTIGKDMLGRPRLRVKHLELPTDGVYHMLINHDPKWVRERTYSFAKVLDGTHDPAIFKNSILLIGLVDEGVASGYRVGNHNEVTMVEITANALGRILSRVRLSRPPWAIGLEVVALLYFAFFLIFFIPRVNIRLGAWLLIIFLITWYAIGVGLLLGYGYWIKFFGPALLAGIGFVTIQLSIHSRMRRQEKLESNKTLGLSYQGQGMLDMAYEKFMRCPVEESSVKNLFYNLGLDFERKRMFNKAVAVYQHIRTDGTFKDIKDRIARLKRIEDPLAMTTSSGASAGEVTMQVDDTHTKPTFGRYEILRELGHGAMGTVYLGRDPKINRKVAIKTLAYTEVDPDEWEEVKERFFREAEAAGKLSHSNIVSIYDVGEEHDMAYIAMELLTGNDLTHHCRKDSLLPVDKVVSIISNVTVALDYAHKQGVIHRDIKPGNIMLLEDDRVKVTDFGIARVVDASQTRTGIVVGTPSYMSPEQVAGKQVDGRSDLFSLGIVFYQLLTGKKPFVGDNITAIMYAISNHEYVTLSESSNEIPSCVEDIVDKLLAKGVSKRFQTAGKLLKALESCKKNY